MVKLAFVMLFYRSLFISLLAHLIFFLNISKPEQAAIKPKKLKTKVRIKTFKRKSSPKSKSSHKASLGWGRLSWSGVTGSKESKVGSTNSKILTLVDSGLTYPEEFVTLGIEGVVETQVVIDRNGKLNESQSYISCESKYLEIYLRRVLRKTLLNNDLVTTKDTGIYKFKFIFELHTGLDKNDQVMLERDSYLYRSAYGGKSNIDKVNKAAAQTIATILNPLSLLRFLPNIQKAKKMRIEKKLRSYQRDSYW